MIKLALIGKNIQHSRSPEIYKKLLKKEIQYDLLDFDNSSMIPTVTELFEIYDGISITSPYKKHFLDSVSITEKVKQLGAINCLAKKNDMIFGENTDYLAIIDILNKLNSLYGKLDVVILGDGVMSYVLQNALGELLIPFKVLSRKSTDSLAQLNIDLEFRLDPNNSFQKIVINTCAREFIFSGAIGNNTIFWDFNYNFAPHRDLVDAKGIQYIDGSELLELQARYALSFWSINLTDLNN
jgi:shikimate dehydrogenase